MATRFLPTQLRARVTAKEHRLRGKFMSCYSWDSYSKGCHLFSPCLGWHSSHSFQLANNSTIHPIHLISTTPSQRENAPMIELICCIYFNRHLASDSTDICRKTTSPEGFHTGLILSIAKTLSQILGFPAEKMEMKETHKLCHLHNYCWSFTSKTIVNTKFKSSVVRF